MKNKIKAICEQMMQVNKEIYEKCHIIVNHYESLRDSVEEVYGGNQRIFCAFKIKYSESLGITDADLNIIINYRIHQIPQSLHKRSELFSITKHSELIGGIPQYAFAIHGDELAHWGLFDIDLEELVEKCKSIDVGAGVKWVQEFVTEELKPKSPNKEPK